ncbi:MAG TPA: N-acetylmuramic acid 6-phosphate etherase [Anaeromyxobacteraceae bacterium]|nr:N-acetylmuramic acid 6-phosphate etherase [Anaeromyxobacteraceae bacterium]
MVPLPPTERHHPDGARLSGLALEHALSTLHRGDAEAVRAVGRALPALARLAALAAGSLAAGGRLVYAGAGTSGRLAAMDAAECPPTFGLLPSQVVALVAGGRRALSRSVEGAEDDREAGRRAVRRARVGPRDLVVGISASGRTPFTLAALAEARARGAATALLSSAPPPAAAARHRIVLDTGPERIAGSTRMKAGTAARMALTLLSTGAMLRLGRIERGRMVDLSAASQKLRRRAVRIVAEVSGASPPRSRAALLRSGWSVRAALADLRQRRPGRRG